MFDNDQPKDTVPDDLTCPWCGGTKLRYSGKTFHQLRKYRCLDSDCLWEFWS